jgi:23S rRNA (cytosine1962-C5)-methyltransferase
MASRRVFLKRGRERAVQQHHPWLFSGAIDRVDDGIHNGDVVEVFSAETEWLARGYINWHSQIAVRLLVWENECSIDDAFWRDRLARAIAARATLVDDDSTTMYRVVNGESDGLPGLIVDRYGEWLVLQALTLGVDKRKDELARSLVELIGDIRGVYERGDVDARSREGLEPLSGCLWGETPPDLVEALENGYRFLVDIKHGHKTGFYLDQRENRGKVRAYSEGSDVLNAFAYSGSFAVYALDSGAANVTSVDVSDDALELARRHVALNQLDATRGVYKKDDVFSRLRAFRAQGRQFDLIILDPPAFASSRSHLRRGARGYKDINWVAFQILRRGGVLFTFSCSAFVSRELFQKIVFSAALDARRDVQILGQLGHALDHPVSVYFPEGEYLKGLICRVW